MDCVTLLRLIENHEVWTFVNWKTPQIPESSLYVNILLDWKLNSSKSYYASIYLFIYTFLFFIVFFVKRYYRLSDSQAETQFTDEVTAITFKYMSICT